MEWLEGLLRIDLDPGNLQLWHETFENIKEPANLLLACESQDEAIVNTKLTWVVGAAIRPALVSSAKEVIDLLQALGISQELAAKAAEHCPGLGQDLGWAFYIERHGLLSASPILNSRDIGDLRKVPESTGET